MGHLQRHCGRWVQVSRTLPQYLYKKTLDWWINKHWKLIYFDKINARSANTTEIKNWIQLDKLMFFISIKLMDIPFELNELVNPLIRTNARKTPNKSIKTAKTFRWDGLLVLVAKRPNTYSTSRIISSNDQDLKCANIAIWKPIAKQQMERKTELDLYDFGVEVDIEQTEKRCNL